MTQQGASQLANPYTVELDERAFVDVAEDTTKGGTLPEPAWFNNVAPDATENSIVTDTEPQTENMSFADALASAGRSQTTRTEDTTKGGTLPEPGWWNNAAPLDDQAELAELAHKKELQQLSEKLHNTVNPENATEVFNAAQAREKAEIEDLQLKLLGMAKPIAESNPEVEATLMTEIVKPGLGSYFRNFYHKAERWIHALLQNARSSKAWSDTARQRNQSKAVLGEGSQYDQTSAVLELQQNPELNTSGGA